MMPIAQKQETEFTPEIDTEIIRGYLDDQEAMFEHMTQQHGFSRDVIAKRASALGINRQLLDQLSLSEAIHGPRPCLRCEKVFLSRGPGNRLCNKCVKQAG